MPARIGKSFDLPTFLADKLGHQINLPSLREAVQSIKPREQAKNLPVEKKINSLVRSIKVDAELVRNKSILIVDDLYQSGISMNVIGMLLYEAGAKRVLGLACEKTIRNDDNVG